MRKELLSLAIYKALNACAAGVYFRAGINICKPHQVYAIITNRCDARCIMCQCWQMNAEEEMDRGKWLSILKELKKFSKSCHVNFSGGEPLLRDDFLDMLRFCADNGIICGFTTNARHIDKDLAKELMGLNLFNINISLDSTIPAVHDKIRGVPGLYGKVIDALEYLQAARRKYNSAVSIFIKPTIMKNNFREMPDLVRFARKISLDGVSFQPLLAWTRNYDSIKIDKPDEFFEVIDEVISLKKRGWRVLNAVSHLEAMKDYCRDHTHVDGTKRCEVGLNNFCIKPNGDVYLCYDYPAVGSLNRESVGDIWSSSDAVGQRLQFKKCRKLCLATCQTKRNLLEKAELFRDLLLRKRGGC